MAEIISTNNSLGNINWVKGLSDPGEMLACGYLPEARRQANEADDAYAQRLLTTLPTSLIERIRTAAINRAGLDTSSGAVAVFSAREVPWHGLGKVISSAATSAEAIAFAALDWHVALWPVSAMNPASGAYTEAPGRMATVREDTGTVLGVVGSNYRPFQNRDAFAFMDSLVGESLAMYETAGALDGGRQVWMLAKIPRQYYLPGQDEILPYVLLTNSHDGTGALRMMPTTVRVVCRNTLNLSMKNGHREHSLHVRHSQSLKTRVEEARRNIGLIGKRLDVWAEEAAALARLQIDGQRLDTYLQDFFPTRVKPVELPADGDGAALLEGILGTHDTSRAVVAELLSSHYAENERQARRNSNILETILENHEGDPSRGTAWGAYNAVSEYVDHQRGSRGRNDAERANNRLDSVWFGSGNDLKQEAYASARAMLTAK